MVYQDAAARALDALGDPTRRAVFETLAIGPHPVWEIAAGLPVSRPAVSQHLRVLKEAGLVRDRRDGNRRVYSADPTGLAALREYLERYWDSALEAFEQAAADAQEAEEAKKANEAKRANEARAKEANEARAKEARAKEANEARAKEAKGGDER